MSNVKDISAKKLGTILGYECYIPNSYFNFISFLKKGCPVWIKSDEEGNCDVFSLNGDNAFEEIASYIKNKLAKRKGYFYRRIKESGILPISCQILNENEVVCAEILVTETYQISSIKLGSSTENDLLKDFFLSDYNIKGYESKVLRFINSTNSKGKQLFKIRHDDDGDYIQLG